MFARKPLWGYRLAVAGMLGVTLLSFMVWQHHLFVSGMNSDLRPFYMLTTELISIPTGFIFLNAIGTLWRARIRFTVPMLFALAFFFNFLIGGLSGVFLSDVPSDVTTHGSYFVMAHFHYTIMGGLVFAFFAADLLLAAEDDRCSRSTRRWRSCTSGDVRLLQPDLLPALRGRLPWHAASRVDVRATPAGDQRLCLDLRVSCSGRRCSSSSRTWSARCVFERVPAAENPWALARARVAAPDARADRELRAHRR